MNNHKLALRLSGYMAIHPIEAVDTKIDEITTLLTANEIPSTYTNRPAISDQISQDADVLSTAFQMMSIVMAAVGARWV